jgi:hypothetical protein
VNEKSKSKSKENEKTLSGEFRRNPKEEKRKIRGREKEEKRKRGEEKWVGAAEVNGFPEMGFVEMEERDGEEE